MQQRLLKTAFERVTGLEEEATVAAEQAAAARVAPHVHLLREVGVHAVERLRAEGG